MFRLFSFLTITLFPLIVFASMHSQLANTATDHELHQPGYVTGSVATITPVANQTPGDMWFDKQSGQYFFWNSSKWVTFSGQSIYTPTITPTPTATFTPTPAVPYPTVPVYTGLTPNPTMVPVVQNGVDGKNYLFPHLYYTYSPNNGGQFGMFVTSDVNDSQISFNAGFNLRATDQIQLITTGTDLELNSGGHAWYFLSNTLYADNGGNGATIRGVQNDGYLMYNLQPTPTQVPLFKQASVTFTNALTPVVVSDSFISSTSTFSIHQVGGAAAVTNSWWFGINPGVGVTITGTNSAAVTTAITIFN